MKKKTEKSTSIRQICQLKRWVTNVFIVEMMWSVIKMDRKIDLFMLIPSTECLIKIIKLFGFYLCGTFVFFYQFVCLEIYFKYISIATKCFGYANSLCSQHKLSAHVTVCNNTHTCIVTLCTANAWCLTFA